MRLLRGWSRKSADRQHRLLDDYRTCFASGAGRRVLEDLLDQAEFYQAAAADAPALALAQHNGKRAVLQHILTRLNASDEVRQGLMRAVIAEREKET
ncbi:MAG: hypothetical protein QNJ84_18945 [Alphaproteobacteria bacterium]|nr:hypothetical protein [Alphaproteobacteria bacterium]